MIFYCVYINHRLIGHTKMHKITIINVNLKSCYFLILPEFKSWINVTCLIWGG